MIATIFKATPQKIEAMVLENDMYNVDFITLKFTGDVAVSGIITFEGQAKPEYFLVNYQL